MAHLLKYILFVRILCSNQITSEDLKDSLILIEEFSADFDKIYAGSDMTYNLHMHLHLPRQVFLFGSLIKCSCFPFENMFRVTRDLFHGVVNFEGQIARHLEARKLIRIDLKQIYMDTINEDIKRFQDKFFFDYNIKKNGILSPREISRMDLKSHEKDLISDYQLLQGHRASFKNIG